MSTVLFIGLNRPSLSKRFITNGFSVNHLDLETYSKIETYIRINSFDAVLLGPDPKYSEDLVRFIRRVGYTGVLLKISEKFDGSFWSHSVGFLNAGADNITIFTAPDEEVLRLVIAASRLIDVSNQKSTFSFLGKQGNILIDDVRKKVWLNGVCLTLTAHEYKVLFLIATHQEGLSNSKLNQLHYDDCYANEYLSRGNMVQVLISRVRKKLQPYFTISNLRKGKARDSEGIYKLNTL